MAKKHKCSCPPPAPAWLTTFSDLMSLLLTFFVMLVAFATFEDKKIKEAIVSLRGAFGIMRPAENVVNEKVTKKDALLNVDKKKGDTEDDQKKKAKIQEMIKNSPADKVEMEETKEGIAVIALSPVFFDPGSAQIKPEARGTLAVIAKAVNLYEGNVDGDGFYEVDIQIRGYTTDATPTLGSHHETTWELSGARAMAILRYLEEREPLVKGARMSYEGHGHHRPRVKRDLGSELNDRVEVHIRTVDVPRKRESLLKFKTEGIPDDTEVLPIKPSEGDRNTRGPPR